MKDLIWEEEQNAAKDVFKQSADENGGKDKKKAEGKKALTKKQRKAK